ncbi:MAG: hypothetical protein WCH74_07675 [Chloroflexota bacterium]
MTGRLAAIRSRRTRSSTGAPTRSPAIAAIVALAMVVGCGQATGSPPASTTPPASAAPTANGTAAPTAPITHATGSTDLVLRVADGGGLLPMEMRLAEMPATSIYGDGRVIRLTADGAGPTDPLVPTLVESRLTPEGLTLVLAAAGDAGLLGPDRRLGLEDVYDLWTVTFTLGANGATHTTWAYALGFPDEAKFAPPDEMAARETLGELFARLKDLPAWLGSENVGADAPYLPARMSVYVAPVMDWTGTVGATPAPATARPGQDIRAWPLDAPPEMFGTLVDEHEGTWRCGVLEPEGTEYLGVGTATNDTRWQVGDRLYRVVVRPLLPDEAGCPG